MPEVESGTSNVGQDAGQDVGGVGTDFGERLRAAVGSEPVATAAGPLAVTVSVGVATSDPGDRDLAALLNRADQALYRAKNDGRNRVRSA